MFSRFLVFDGESTKERVLFKFFLAVSSSSFVIVAMVDFWVLVVPNCSSFHFFDVGIEDVSGFTWAVIMWP